jgi:hypothetical protein
VLKVYGTDKKNIEMTRGDSETIQITFKNGGAIVPFAAGDTVCFSVKESVNTNQYIFQVKCTIFEADGSAIIQIKPSDTKNCKFKTYKYDIQLTKADGTVTTIIEPHEFRVGEEITHD